MSEVSIIVPTYQREEKLERALESINSQTYRDFQIIVVDDNPSEKFREKVEEIVENLETDNITRLVNGENQGVSSARNLGIEKAEGEIVAFLDDDDEWKPEKIEKQVEKIKQEGINAVYTASEMYDEGVKDIVRKTPGLDLNAMLERDRIGSPSKVMIEKEFLEKVGGFDEDIPSAEDWDLWIRLMKRGCNFAYIDEPLTRYHLDDDSKSSQKDIATEGREKITEKHSKLLNEAGTRVKARHHLNRAKKQYQLGDNNGTQRHLKKTLRNNPLEPEAYALVTIYLIRTITGLDLIPIAAKIKGKLK